MENTTGVIEEPSRSAGSPRSKKLTAGLAGGIILEWYDWNVYGLMAAFLAPHFFPSDSEVASTLSALAVFALGFFARPLGAAILGPIADRTSHRRILIFSVSSMAVCSMLIGILPTYETIGVAAGFLLLLLRLLQGLATGAEAGVANAVAIELAPRGMEGRYLGLISGSSIQIGIVGSSVVSFFTTLALSDGIMNSWGWRVPFLVGGLMGLVVIYLRRSLPETRVLSKTDTNEDLESTTSGVWKSLWQVRFALLAVTLVIGAVQIGNYTMITGLPNLANGVYDENSTAVFGIVAGMGMIWIATGPLIGAFADKFRPSRAFTLLRLLMIPALFTILVYSRPGLGLMAIVAFVGGSVVGFNMNLYNYIAVTLMPKRVRTTGVAVGYALGVSIFGGTASYVLIWLQQIDQFWIFPVYGSVVCLASVIVYWMAKKRGHVYIGD